MRRGGGEHDLLRDAVARHGGVVGGADLRRLPLRAQAAEAGHARGRLARGGEELRTFLHAIEPLRSRVHALWVQLPASFGPGDLGTLAGFLRGLPAEHRYAVEVRHRAFFEDAGCVRDLERVLSRAGAEWVPFDTTVFFQSPPTSDAERDAWTKKPRVPRRSAALTDRPIVRYLGRDDTGRTVEGWRFWAAGSPSGCGRDARRPCSSTPRTTPTRSTSRAASTPR
nr:DUF72 domain-containing protein [Actinomadura madurae]